MRVSARRILSNTSSQASIVSVLFIVFSVPLGIGNTPQIAVSSRILAISTTGASVALFVKGTRIVDAAGHSLRDLRALPSAKVIDRRKSP